MGFYADRIVPVLIDLSMRNRLLRSYRQRVTGAAGRVLEIGIGSGPNLPMYGVRLTHVTGLDPSPSLMAKTRQAVQEVSVPVDLVEGSAEAIPLGATSVDTVVTTCTLCSIPDAPRALAEMRRVLCPSGPTAFLSSTGARLTRVSAGGRTAARRCGGGSAAAATLNRAISDLITSAGFRIERLDTGYMRGPKPMTFMYEGSARPG